MDDAKVIATAAEAYLADLFLRLEEALGPFHGRLKLAANDKDCPWMLAYDNPKGEQVLSDGGNILLFAKTFDALLNSAVAEIPPVVAKARRKKEVTALAEKMLAEEAKAKQEAAA